MKEWREYHSEEGGFWEFLRDTNHPETPEDLRSPAGNAAIMARRMKPGDVVLVSIIPKARQIDSVTGEIRHKNKFYLKVESLLEPWQCTTSKAYLKDEVMALAQLFVGLEKRAAERVWKAQKLGSEGERFITG